MHAHSYKHFLTSLEGLPRFSSLQKLALFVFAILIITFGVVSTLLYYQYTRETPIRLKKTYLETAIIQFDSTKSTTEELIASFKVAGAKNNYFLPQDEDFQTKEAYFSSIDNLEKMTQQIKLARENLKAAEKSRGSKTTPAEFSDLDIEIKNHHNYLFDYLNGLLTNYQIAKELTLALGPDLYFPTLTQKGLWEKQDKAQITSYYQQKLDNADNALAKLATITPTSDFENYYRIEIAYLELLVNLAKDINNTLSLVDETQPDTANQLEKAYAQVVIADKDSQELILKILQVRSSLFDTQNNLNQLAQIKITQNSIGPKLEYFADAYAQVKIITLPEIPQISILSF